MNEVVLRRWCVLLVAVTAVSWCAAAKPPAKPGNPPERQSPAAPAAAGPVGEVQVDITDLLARELPGFVTLRGAGNAAPIVIEAPQGRARQKVPLGRYKADVYVYDAGVPMLVDVKDITVTESLPATVLLNLAYGGSGGMPVQAFDRDFDLVLDIVEEKEGTNPDDPASVPRKETLTFDAPVLSKEHGWYRGELHAHSTYGAGSESVADLVKRAEKARLDFLAITDRNTLAACNDPGFRSNKVVLIPAMAWGSDTDGVALIYGPKTMPETVRTRPEAQAVLRLVQAQGGIFAIAHPCFPTAPWQWGLGYVNAIEVWCRDWRGVPPMMLDNLTEPNKERRNGKLIYSIAQAAALSTAGAVTRGDVRPPSANEQAAVFWDMELANKLRACAIAGSGSSSPKVPIGSPVTYVYAKEKSWPAILEGIRLGRTYVSSGPAGPTIQFCADVQKNGTIDVAMGGVVPLGIETELQIVITRAKGKKVEVLRNGLPIIAQTIEGPNFLLKFSQTPLAYSVYRVQVLDTAVPRPGLGNSEVLALSSPIYFDDLILVRQDLDPTQAWIKIQTQYQEDFYPDMFVPPSNQRVIEPKWLY